jgi:hypothetical protein
MLSHLFGVMAGLAPRASARDKRGHDGGEFLIQRKVR